MCACLKALLPVRAEEREGEKGLLFVMVMSSIGSIPQNQARVHTIKHAGQAQAQHLFSSYMTIMITFYSEKNEYKLDIHS